MSEPEYLEIDYTNFRGERSHYVVEPLDLALMESRWHPGKQWILIARDVERDVVREFAWKDIHASWRVRRGALGLYVIVGPVERMEDDQGL